MGIGYVRAAELILLGLPFDAKRAGGDGLVTQVVSDQNLLTIATETARKLAEKPAAALEASKRFMKPPFREQIKAAMRAEMEEFSARFALQTPRSHSQRFFRSARLISPRP
jgi:enoyl-CoA hydratase/carnithine racemase